MKENMIPIIDFQLVLLVDYYSNTCRIRSCIATGSEIAMESVAKREDAIDKMLLHITQTYFRPNPHILSNKCNAVYLKSTSYHLVLLQRLE